MILCDYQGIHRDFPFNLSEMIHLTFPSQHSITTYDSMEHPAMMSMVCILLAQLIGSFLIFEPLVTSVLFVVIKPIYGAASIGVVRVSNYEDLEKTYGKVQEEMASAKIVDGALVQGSSENNGVRSSFSYSSFSFQYVLAISYEVFPEF